MIYGFTCLRVFWRVDKQVGSIALDILAILDKTKAGEPSIWILFYINWSNDGITCRQVFWRGKIQVGNIIALSILAILEKAKAGEPRIWILSNAWLKQIY